jgi:hypothetical protein
VRRCTGASLAACLWLAPVAHAALGENWTPPPATGNARSVQIVVPASSARFESHVALSPEGTQVTEYSDANGTVFAVAWIGPFKPDLQLLFGRYFGAFRDAPRAATGSAARGMQRIENGGMVVLTGGRPRAFFGRAWVPALVPPGVNMLELP